MNNPANAAALPLPLTVVAYFKIHGVAGRVPYFVTNLRRHDGRVYGEALTGPGGTVATVRVSVADLLGRHLGNVERVRGLHLKAGTPLPAA